MAIIFKNFYKWFTKRNSYGIDNVTYNRNVCDIDK